MKSQELIRQRHSCFFFSSLSLPVCVVAVFHQHSRAVCVQRDIYITDHHKGRVTHRTWARTVRETLMKSSPKYERAESYELTIAGENELNGRLWLR